MQKGNRRGGRRETRRRTLTLSNLLLALIGFLFLACSSVVIVLNLRTIYYFDIQALELEKETGYSEETLRANYDALIDYNLITNHEKVLELPDFPMSEHGAIHFREVKEIFGIIQILCAASGAVLAVGLVKKLFRKDYGSLLLMAFFTFVIPLLLGVLAVFWWEEFFVTFHKIFFDNDYWLFNPVTDPVIHILPDTFFFHCAAIILLFLLLGGLVTASWYRFLTRKYRR